MPKYEAWDEYGDPQCERHGESQPCSHCEGDDYNVPLEPSLGVQKEQHFERVDELVTEALATTLGPRYRRATLDALSLVKREHKLWYLAEKLDSRGEHKIAQELRKTLGHDE